MVAARATPRAHDTVVAVDGLNIRVSIAGPDVGYPLLLVNGIGAPLELWGGFRSRLSTQTIALDAPGTGRSPAPWRPRSMWELARSVSRMLDQLGFDRVDVLGISWGGGLAQHLALVRGRRVRRLVLVCTGFGAGSVPGDLRAALELLRPQRYFSPAHLARVGPALFGGETRRRPNLLVQQGRLRSLHRPSTRGYVYQLLTASTWATLPWLPLLRAETLVLLGGDDPIVHTVNGRILKKALPHATLRVVPGAGHLFPLDQPAEAAAIVRDFLRM
ncbi:MAG: alpha/beta fold hydrolase [Candidatus Dormibacteraeota bacterium]|nr:alpha/beta fold hydrolase [Candidatus Dormibacteraeota bacterium]